METTTKTLEATLAPPTAHKERKLCDLLETYREGLHEAFNAGCETMSATSDVVIVGGDNLISFDIGEFLDAFEATGEPTLAAYDVGSYERASSYGLIELDSAGYVVDFQEKPDEPRSTLVSIACYLDSARESRPSREGRAFRRSVGTED